MAGGAVGEAPGMAVAGTAAVPPRLDTSLVEGHAGHEEGGLEDVRGHNAYRGVDAEGLQGRQDSETADTEGNYVRCWFKKDRQYIYNVRARKYGNLKK